MLLMKINQPEKIGANKIIVDSHDGLCQLSRLLVSFQGLQT